MSEMIFLDEACKALGWQGGTIHQVLDEIKRLKKRESDLENSLRTTADLLSEFCCLDEDHDDEYYAHGFDPNDVRDAYLYATLPFVERNKP